MFRRLLLLFILVFLFYSCKKESDTFSPKITITSPFEHQIFNVNEYVNIIANICDDRKLEYIEVKLLNEDFVTVLGSQTLYPENNCTDINLSILIDDTHLPTGTYYILVKASDGVNVTNEFREISINGLNKKLKFILVLTKNGDNITINKIDSLNNITQVKTLTGDYCGSAVSSDAQQFYIAGKYTGDVSVYSINDWQLQWNIPVIVSPPFPYFEAIDVHNRQLYVSYREGKFEIYNETGSIRASRVIENGEYPLKFLPFNDYLITYEISPIGLQKHLVVYFTPSFAIYKKILINFEIQKIFPLGNDQFLLFCNDVNQGFVKVFDASTGSVTNKYTFTTGTFKDVVQAEATNYLFLSEDYIYLYSYESNSNFPWSAAQNSHCVVFDETEAFYYFSENYFTVKKMNFLNSISPLSFVFQDTIINILPVYNKD